MKFKVVNENERKKSFVFRIQSPEKPMWLNYYDTFDGYYISLPKEVLPTLNAEIKKICGDFEIKLTEKDKDYDCFSMGIKLYELKEKFPNKHAIIDVAILFSCYEFGKKNGLAKKLLGAKTSNSHRDYLAADDYFDDIDIDALELEQDENPTPAANIAPVDGSDLPY